MWLLHVRTNHVHGKSGGLELGTDIVHTAVAAAPITFKSGLVALSALAAPAIDDDLHLADTKLASELRHQFEPIHGDNELNAPR